MRKNYTLKMVSNYFTYVRKHRLYIKKNEFLHVSTHHKKHEIIQDYSKNIALNAFRKCSGCFMKLI